MNAKAIKTNEMVAFAKAITGLKRWTVKSSTSNKIILVHSREEIGDRREVFRQLKETRPFWGGRRAVVTRNPELNKQMIQITSAEGREVKMLWSPRGQRLILKQA